MKLLLVGNEFDSNWISCKSIKKNLLLAYQLNPNIDIELFAFDNENIKLLSSQIISNDYEKIVFIDHRPNPAYILNQLIKHIPIIKIPPIVIHIYGDFTFFAADFLSLNTHFIGHQITFAAASNAQKKLVNFFLAAPNCKYFPFSIDKEFFHFNQIFRNNFRDINQISEHQKVILYAGRLSLQKNIDIVLKEFDRYKSKHHSDVQLYLAGPFDDFGARFMGGRTLEGYYFNKISAQINSSPFKSDIHLLGNLSNTELRDAYCGADLYINYSLHHDEDFGIAPLEAHACGLPLLLTPWGGFNDFPAHFSSINLDSIDYSISADEIEKCIDLRRTTYNFPEHELISILNCQETFNGFNDKINNYINYFSTNESFLPRPNIQSTPSNQSLYFDIYSNYFKNSSNSENMFNVNWSFDHINNSKHESGFNNNNGTKESYEELLPFSTSYYSTIPADFFYFGNLGKIKNDELIIRSGKLSIEEFYKKNSFQNFSGLFVSKELHETCQLNCNYGAYSILANSHNSNYNEFIISICAIENISSFILNSLIDKFIELKDHNPNLKIKILTTANPIFESSISIVKSFLRNNGYVFTLYDWKIFRISSDLRDCFLFEITDQNIISDTFSRFFALSKGATTNLPANDFDLNLWRLHKEFKLSPFHRLVLYKRLT